MGTTVVLKTGETLDSFRVLDIGAGSGLVGEKLYKNGITDIVGINLLEEAIDAINREQPGIYRDCYAMDMSDISKQKYSQLQKEKFNILTCGSALDFSDIPPLGFAAAYNLLVPDAWFVVNIKGVKDFFDTNSDSNGNIASFIRYLVSNKIASVTRNESYQHRIAINQRPIIYTAVLGRKLDNIPLMDIMQHEAESEK